ncbi:hypothetical protein BC629DRAFT_894787 [Irpex lacteus]|nr:hypothetical protein BC629DRAFT_894787 [Irpex lacteus]
MQELAVPCNAVLSSSLSRAGLENKACQRLDALLGRHLLYRNSVCVSDKGSEDILEGRCSDIGVVPFNLHECIFSDWPGQCLWDNLCSQISVSKDGLTATSDWRSIYVKREIAKALFLIPGSTSNLNAAVSSTILTTYGTYVSTWCPMPCSSTACPLVSSRMRLTGVCYAEGPDA